MKWNSTKTKPPSMENVLLTAVREDGQRYVTVGYYFDCDDEWCESDPDPFGATIKVIAWMPMPEAFKQ